MFNGQATIYKRGHGGPFHDSYVGNLFQASGIVNFSATANEISKETLVKRVMEDLYEDMDEVTDDMLPDTSMKKVRIFSNTICLLRNGYSEKTKNDLYFFVGLIEGDQGEMDWSEYQDLPAGFLLSENGGAELNFATLTKELLDAHFRHPMEIDFPFIIDLHFGWYLDYSKVRGPCYEWQLSNFPGRIAPATIPWKVKGFSAQNMIQRRVIAGPALGELRFVTHPSSQLQLRQDPEPCPAGCISTIVEEQVHTDNNELFVLSSQGEIGKIDW